MAETMTMPDLGFDAASGVLASWLIEVGDTVTPGEPLAEIESDKVTLEVEASLEGVVLELLLQPGDAVTVGDPVARIGSADELSAVEFSPEPKEQSPPAVTETEDEPQSKPASPSPMPATAAQGEAIHSLGTTPDGVAATPIARRMAQDHNLDLAQVGGSGPGGRVLRGDVERFLAQEDGQPPDGEPEPVIPDQKSPKKDGDESKPSSLRQAIAQRMVHSKQTIPHFYITASVLMDEALALRRQINDALPEAEKVTVNDLILKAVALALRDFPDLNATYQDGRAVRHEEINVGMAVAVAGGLLTVVSQETDRRTISDIASSNRALIQRARAGKVKPGDVTGGTFTVSNLGGYETDHFAAIINPPQVAILGAATARPQPVVVEEQVVVRTVMQMTISADHRATDGVQAAQFLQRVRALLENPMQLLL